MRQHTSVIYDVFNRLGIFPVGARIVQSGAIGYFPPEWLVKTLNSDDSLLLEYSTIQNTSPDPTTVILELSFSTNGNSTPEGINIVSATIGGVSLSLEFLTVQNVSSFSFEHSFIFVQQQIDPFL